MDPSLSGRVALAGIGETAIGALPGRTYLQLQAEAVLAALEDAIAWDAALARDEHEKRHLALASVVVDG